MLQAMNTSATAGSDAGPRCSQAWLPAAAPSDMPT